jgi:hypothetical protein
MGIKSTRELTRKEAELLYWQLHDKLHPRAIGVKDSMLEDELGRLNDEVNGGEGFTNYRIVREP